MNRASERQHDLQSSSKGRRNVSFGTVSVREYKQVILDVHHPDASFCWNGPLIGLGWKFVTKRSVSVRSWENAKRMRASIQRCAGKKTSSKSTLLLTANERISIAKKNGFSDKAIQTNMRQASKAMMMHHLATSSLNHFSDLERQAIELIMQKRQDKQKKSSRHQRASVKVATSA